MVTDRIGADAADFGKEKSSCVAQQFLASLEPLVESEDDERRFTQARELVNGVMPKGMFGSILRRLATSSPQPYKRRR